MPTEEEKDSELLRLANAAVQPSTGSEIPPQQGAGPNAMGLDLSSYNTPNQPAPPTEPTPVAPDGTPIVPGQATGTTADPNDIQSVISQAKAGQPPAEGQTPVAPVTPATPPSRPVSAPTEAGSVQALNNARSTAYAAAGAKAAEGPAATEKAAADAAAQRTTANQARDNATETDEHQAKVEEGRKRVEAIRDAAYDDLKKFKFYDFWKDGSDSDRMQAKISIMLGAWANSGQFAATNQNQALANINAQIDRQHKIDDAEVRKRYDMAKLKQEGAEAFEKNMQSDLATMKFKQSQLTLAVADEMKAKLIENGIPLDQAQNNTAVKQMIAKAEQSDAEGYEKLMAVHGNLALHRAQLDATRPDSPAVQTATADYINKNPGDQAGAMKAATAAGSRNPTATVTKLMNEPDRIEAARNKSLEKVGNQNAALRKERIAANIHDMGEGLKAIPPGVITPEVLDRVQKNRAELHATSHPDSMIGAMGNNLGRSVGVVAKSEFDGLTPQQTAAMRGLQRALQHGSEMQPAQGAEVKRGYMDTYEPKPGTDQSSIDNALAAMRQQHDDYKAIIDDKNIGGRADKPAPVATKASKYAPGSQVTYKGKIYRVGDDGDTLNPVQ